MLSISNFVEILLMVV